MLIDWFTVGAQVLNFAILAWLLKRFLYQPILDAIDAREQRIAKELADAADKMTQADARQTLFETRNREFDHQRDALLAKATHEANDQCQRLLDDARKAADDLSAKRHAALDSEFERLRDHIARQSRDEVFALARKVLADLADATLEERLCKVFADHLRHLDDDARQRLIAAMKTSAPVLLRSAFALPPEQQQLIRSALDEVLGAGVDVRFEVAPDVIGGLELSANGWRVAWNMADYLGSIEARVDGLLKSPTRSEADAVESVDSTDSTNITDKHADEH